MSEKRPTKENILMVIPHYGFGGAQRVFSQLVSGLSDQYNVIEIVFNNDEKDVYSGIGEKISLNVTGGSFLLSKAFQFLKRCWKLNRLKAKYQCKFCISHLEGANFINILSFGPGKKILCVHGSKTAEDSNKKGLLKVIENKILIPWLFSMADKIVSVSYGISHELKTFYGIAESKIQVIQNGIDVDNIKKLSDEEIPAEHKSIFEKKVIIYSGRLAPQKNPLPLIEIYSKVKSKIDCNLLIVGDGPLKSEMQQRCKNLGTDGIYFIGFQKNPFKYLQRSALFLSPSDFEGFPLAVCEALACGLPIIATDCPTGVREILSPASQRTNYELAQAEYAAFGILMPLIQRTPAYDLSIEHWGDTILKLMNENELVKYRKNSIQRARELSLEKSIDKWKKLLESSFT